MTALLDHLADQQAGIEHDGSPPPPPDPEAMRALQAYNWLATGMGGIDWQGLEPVAGVLGYAEHELEMLMHRLQAIKTHPPRKQGA